MLIEFKVTNFRSIRDTQTLSMAAAKSSELEDTNTFSTGLKGLPRLLRSAVIYGPNAGGKSNLLKAMTLMQDFVLDSHAWQAGNKIGIQPFMFDVESSSRPSAFEVTFIMKGVRYQYGFAANTERFTREWLFAYPAGRMQKWFEREYNPKTQQYDWYFGPNFKGHRQMLQDATRPNALFLSTATQLNNVQLFPIYIWFFDFSIFSSGRLPAKERTIGLCQMEHYKKKVLKFLNEADLSIADILLERDDRFTTILTSGYPEIKAVKFAHARKGSDSKGHVPLALEDESDGTRKLFDLASPFLLALERGGTLVIDELDNSLHPLLVRYIIKLFHNPDVSKNNAQLIFTTHDTSVLDNEIFRRDQVWFIERDEKGSSQLYPLSDFSPRKGEALSKGYLQGRYGALPFIGDLKF